MGYLIGSILGSLFIVLLVAVPVYVIQALAWQRVFSLCGHYRPWAAWIPIYNLIVMCECCGTDDVDLIGPIHIPMRIFKWWWAPMLVVWIVPLVGVLVGLAFTYLSLGWLYMTIFSNVKGTSPQDEMLCGYLCVLNPILLCVVLFKIEPIRRD